MRLLLTPVIPYLLVSLAGCGNVSAEPACSATFTPCGGDIVGTWTVDGVCNFPALQTTTQCPGSPATLSPTITGTWTFAADGTYSAALTVDESGTATLPAACLPGVTSCSALSSSNTSNGVTSMQKCTGDPSKSCTCVVSTNSTPTEMGTYATAGDNVSPTSSGVATGIPSGYCVSGSQLQLALVDIGSTVSTNAYVLYSKR